MKRLHFLSAVFALPLILAPMQVQGAASVDDVESRLRALNDHFLGLLDRIDDSQWNFKPAEFRHTVGEEAEHLALAHQGLQKIILRAMKRGEQPDRAKALSGKEEFLRERMLDPENPAENFRSNNKLRSKAEVVEYFGTAQRKALKLLHAVPNLDRYVYKHPSPKYGELTGLQWFYYLVYHGERHANWIEKMLHDAEFPGAKSGS